MNPAPTEARRSRIGTVKPVGRALEQRIVAQAQVRLGHAHWQFIEAQLGVQGNLLLGFFGVFHTVSAVDLLADGFDLLFDAGALERVQEFEVAGFLAGCDYSFAEGRGACAAFHPVTGDNGVFSASLDCEFANQFDFSECIILEAVDGHDHGDAEALGVLNVGLQIRHTGFEQLEVLFGVFGSQWGASFDCWTAAVHLERAHGSNQYHTVGDQAGVAAFDVEEFFHADVSAETGLCDYIIGQLESNSVGNDRTVAVRDIRERSGVYESRGAFQSLHQGGHDRVLHQDSHGTGSADVFGSDGLASLAGGDDDFAEAVAHICQVGGQGQDGHDLAGNRNVITSFAGEAQFFGALANRDAAQHAVVDVDHTAPGQGFGVDVETREAGALFFGQVVGIGLLYAQFLQSLEHRKSEFPAAIFCRRAQAIEKGFIALA